MPRTTYLKCPPLKSGKPELGETRTLPSGDLEYKEAISGDWRPAVRLNDVRDTLIANAAIQGAYTHDHGAGKEVQNVTAYLPADKDFGGDFNDRPPELKQIGRKADQHKKLPEGVKTHLGRVLLDPYDYPIRNFPELPATLSTDMKGWEVEHHLRKNLAIKSYDLMALCMSNYTDGNGKSHQGPPRIASLTEKATKFRRIAGLPSLKIKSGSDNINNYVKSLLPQGAETLEGLEGDLNPEEVKASRAMNAGKYPNRRRKEKREEEARAREEQTNQLGVHDGHQSAINLAILPAVTEDDPADANNRAPSVGGKGKEPRGLKRGLIAASPELYPEDRPNPSKRQKCETAAGELKVPTKRRSQESRYTNSISPQLQQAAQDPSQFSLGVNALQPAFQRDAASFDQSYSWSALALNAEGMATPKIGEHSGLIEPRPWRTARAFDGNLYSSLADDITANESKPGRVRDISHLENNLSESYTSYRTDQYTSYSNFPAYDTAVAESSGWTQTYNNTTRNSNTTAGRRAAPDHLMASAYTNPSPARHQYTYEDTYWHSESTRSLGPSYCDGLPWNEHTYTVPTVHQPANLAHSATSETGIPVTTAFTAAGYSSIYSRDQQYHNGSYHPAIDDTLDFSTPNRTESGILGTFIHVSDGDPF